MYPKEERDGPLGRRLVNTCRTCKRVMDSEESCVWKHELYSTNAAQQVVPEVVDHRHRVAGLRRGAVRSRGAFAQREHQSVDPMVGPQLRFDLRRGQPQVARHGAKGAHAPHQPGGAVRVLGGEVNFDLGAPGRELADLEREVGVDRPIDPLHDHPAELVDGHPLRREALHRLDRPVEVLAGRHVALVRPPRRPRLVHELDQRPPPHERMGGPRLGHRLQRARPGAILDRRAERRQGAERAAAARHVGQRDEAKSGQRLDRISLAPARHAERRPHPLFRRPPGGRGRRRRPARCLASGILGAGTLAADRGHLSDRGRWVPGGALRPRHHALPARGDGRIGDRGAPCGPCGRGMGSSVADPRAGEPAPRHGPGRMCGRLSGDFVIGHFDTPRPVVPPVGRERGGRWGMARSASAHGFRPYIPTINLTGDSI